MENLSKKQIFGTSLWATAGLGVMVLILAGAIFIAFEEELSPLAFGDSITIYNDGTGSLTCYVNVYDDGKSFTIPEGENKKIYISQRAAGRCYCPENYQEYEVIDSYTTHSFHVSRFTCDGGATTTTTPGECDVWSYDINGDCYISGWDWSIASDDFHAGKISEACEYEIHQTHLNEVKNPDCVPQTTITIPMQCTPNEVETRNYRCVGNSAYYDIRQCYSDGSGWGSWGTSYDNCNDDVCVAGVCVESPDFCTDTDGGQNYDLAGEINYRWNNEEGFKSDYCEDDGMTLHEFYCIDGGGYGEMQNWYCPNGCVSGACVEGGDEDPCPSLCGGYHGDLCCWTDGVEYTCNDGEWIKTGICITCENLGYFSEPTPGYTCSTVYIPSISETCFDCEGITPTTTTTIPPCEGILIGDFCLGWGALAGLGIFSGAGGFLLLMIVIILAYFGYKEYKKRG